MIVTGCGSGPASSVGHGAGTVFVGWRISVRVARLPAWRWSASTAATSGDVLDPRRWVGDAEREDEPGAWVRIIRPYARRRAADKGRPDGRSGDPASISGCAASARRCS